MSRTLDYTAGSGQTCEQRHYGAPGETNKVRVDLRALLRDGNCLTGTPTVSVTGPTVSAAAISTIPLVINGETAEPGKAVTFTITGGTDGVDYSVKVLCGTNVSETKQANCIYKVREPTAASP
jgi:hypothetical protein